MKILPRVARLYQDAKSMRLMLEGEKKMWHCRGGDRWTRAFEDCIDIIRETTPRYREDIVAALGLPHSHFRVGAGWLPIIDAVLQQFRDQ